MCGRFTLRVPEIDWGQLFCANMDRVDVISVGPPRFNIAPTQNVKCIHHDPHGDRLTAANYRWGLVPAWAKDIRIGTKMINARSETLDSKPSFIHAFASRRCLVPMDGYYEWAQSSDGKGKQPFLIEPSDGRVKFMAGLWEENQQLEDHEAIRSCTIITTPANFTTAQLHQRMPAFIEESNRSAWLDPRCRDLAELKTLLRPAEEDLLKLTAVSRHVNSPRNEGEQCVLPVDDATSGGQQVIRFD